MSETTPPTETTESQQQGDPAGEQLGESGEKALRAERTARKAAEKTAADLKARLDQIEQANLSELEKAQRAAKDAQDQLDALTRANLRTTVALAKGLPADLVDFLTGDTEEEIARRADVLLARLSATPPAPRPDLTQGGGGGTPPALNSDALTNALKAAVGAT